MPSTTTHPANPRDRLVLREWQLWHTYTSAYVQPIPHLESVARNLVRWGVADCAIASEGVAFWCNGRSDLDAGIDGSAETTFRPRRADERKAVNRGEVKLEPAHDWASARVVFPSGVSSWAMEIMGSWAQTRLAERRLFGDSPLPPAYVWAQLGACSLIADGPRRHQLIVYPALKLFATGVVIVQFRMMSPARSVYVDEYVRHYLNASLREFRWVAVPPGIAAWAPMAVPEEGIFRRFRLPHTAFLQWYHQRQVRRRSFTAHLGDFAFEQTLLGEAKQQAAVGQALKEAEPELERLVRDATLAAAAAQGIHLTDDFRIESIDQDVQSAMLDEPDSSSGDDVDPAISEREGVDLPDLCRRRSAETQSERVAVDWERLEQDARRVSLIAAKRAGRALAKQAIASPAAGADTFSSVALTIMRVVGYVAVGRVRHPRRGVALAVIGPGVPNELINHWAGRPHTHLFRFANQTHSARENEVRFKGDLAGILARTPPGMSEAPPLPLPPSSRLFDDMGAYLSIGGTLWIHTRRSLGYSVDDPGRLNRGYHIHDNQVKVELLEYGYALHRRIADRALRAPLNSAQAIEAMIQAQADLAEFEWALQDTGSFGEVRDLLEHGWSQYGVPKIRERVKSAIESRRELASFRRGRTMSRWMSFVALVAGILAVPPLADGVLRPAWSVMQLPRPAGSDGFTLLLVGTAVLFLGMALLAGYRWSRNPTIGKDE